MTSSKVFSWEVCLPLSRIEPYYPHTAILSKMFRSCSVLLALVRSCNFLRKCYEFSCFWYIFLVIWCREFIGISLFMWNCGGNCDEHFLTSSQMSRVRVESRWLSFDSELSETDTDVVEVESLLFFWRENVTNLHLSELYCYRERTNIQLHSTAPPPPPSPQL